MTIKQQPETVREIARTYTVVDMQRFFIKRYRPTITRKRIIKEIQKVRMRYNENPYIVAETVKQALLWANATIMLLNLDMDDRNLKIAPITNPERFELLKAVFCTTNENNNNSQGAVNKLMQRRLRKLKPDHDLDTWIAIAREVAQSVSGTFYAEDHQCKIRHYDPYPLPLWEKQTNQKPSNPSSLKPKTPNYSRKRKRFPRQPTQNDSQPPTKRPKFDPKSKSKPKQKGDTTKMQCWRCGRRGHSFKSCVSGKDINGKYLGKEERREISEMEFRSSYPNKPPRPLNQAQVKQKPQRWNKYGKSKGSKLHNGSNTRHQPDPPQQQPQVNTIVAELHDLLTKDTYTSPAVLNRISTLQQQMNPGNNPRQS